MSNQELKQIIKEFGDGLSSISEDQIAEIITQVIEELLPLAILSMRDDSIKIDNSELIKEEYHERRTWGKERQELEENIMQRRELLEHIRIVKTSTENLMVVDHGSLLMIAPQTAMTHIPLTKQSSKNMSAEYTSESYSSERIEKKHHNPRIKSIQFAVDNSLYDKLDNRVFAKFCFTIEKVSRYFAMTHTNEFVFILKERKDVELPDWYRTVLYVRFPKMQFKTADMLWTSLSNETRNELNKTLKQLSKEDQEQFKNFITSFNVEMDY